MEPEVTPAAATESIVATPAHVPTVETVVTAPVVETPVTPVVEAPTAEVVTPAAEPEKPAEVKPHTEVKTLLEETVNEAEKAPEGETAEEGEKKTDEKQPEKPAEVQKPETPLVYELKLPEAFEPQEAQIGAYTDVLREHNIAPEVGQRLLDMHAEHVRSLAENTYVQQHEAFAAMRREWVDQIKSDALLGGNGFETTKRAVARARDLIVPEADRASFNEFLSTTGAGDHPAFWRALYRVANLFDEPVSPSPNRQPSPTANPEPRRGVMGLFDKKSSNSFSSR